MGSLLTLFRKIVFKEKASGAAYLKALADSGAKIGEDVIIYAPTKTEIDKQYPWLIEIGNHVRITQGVIMLTHDYSWSVFKQISGEILGNARPIKIGNNVFIGMNSIILGGAEIGDNVIIGAGSIVSKKCESNSVYAGNPARKIMGLDEYTEKRRKEQFTEAKNMAQRYNSKFGCMPPSEIFHEFFMLFESGESLNKVFENKLKLGNNYSESIAFMKKQKAFFDSYEDFLEACFRDKE